MLSWTDIVMSVNLLVRGFDQTILAVLSLDVAVLHYNNLI